jgi:hypothetical protein
MVRASTLLLLRPHHHQPINLQVQQQQLVWAADVSLQDTDMIDYKLGMQVSKLRWDVRCVMGAFLIEGGSATAVAACRTRT